MRLTLHLTLFVAFACLDFAKNVSPGATPTPARTDLELQAKKILNVLNKEVTEWQNRVTLASWAYESNLTESNQREYIRVSSEFAAYRKAKWPEIMAFPWHEIEDYETKRQFAKHARLGLAALDEQAYKEYLKTVGSMKEIYSKLKACRYKDGSVECGLFIEPLLAEALITSRDAKGLTFVWVQWRKESGEKIKPFFPRYVELSNQAALLNNFTDAAASWLQEYDTDNFTDQLENLWQQIRPLYLELHAYVREKLRQEYGDEVVSRDGPMPAHLFGNIWAQSWQHTADFSTPYPKKKLPDVTAKMIEQGYDANRIFRLADSFFTSLNLSAVPESFWSKSILERPEDGRELVCHASAWDFYDSKDVRIKQCSRINVEDLLTAHHEMGHIQYYMQYKDLPVMFREGANPGFHEAISDVMSLSVSTMDHLKRINLLEQDAEEDSEAVMNYLYKKGLEKIPFLPFSYAIDKWRLDVFRGKTTPNTYNCDWWKLVDELQGIEPPVDRSEEDFDVADKYLVAAGTEYIRYFVGTVVQFQFHKALCQAAGQYDPENLEVKPLHRCDIYQSQEAGRLLGSMLKLGSSKPWPDAMEVITGQREMDASGLLEYFNPLYEWLKAKNKETGAHVGWNTSAKRCVQSRSEFQGLDFLSLYLREIHENLRIRPADLS